MRTARGSRALRWFREHGCVHCLARDAGISQATGYRYLHEGIDILADQAPALHEVLMHCQASGGNVQFLSAPDGTPLWVSEVEPGSVPDIAAARAPCQSHAADRDVALPRLVGGVFYQITVSGWPGGGCTDRCQLRRR